MAALPLLLAALGAASPMHAMRTCAQPTAASQTRMMIFGPSESQKRAQEEQMKVQQAMLARRRNPKATEKYFKDLEERREKTSVQWFDKFAWQRKADSADYNKMDEFKKRLSAGKIKAHTHTHARTRTRTHARTHAHTHMHSHTHTHHTRTHITHAHTHTHTPHTHTHRTRTQS